VTWVIWRGHRATLLVAATVAVVAALLMVVLLGTDGLGAVRGTDGSTRRQLVQATVWFTTLVPALVGAFCGAPLLAGDLERGTHVLLLTQAASRRRWAATSLVLVGGVAVVAVTVLTAAVAPLNTSVAWYPLESFSTTGAVPFARALSALALGALVGLLVRRVTAASVLTLAVVIGTEVALAALRNLLVPPVLRTAALPYGGNVDSTRDQPIDWGYTVGGAPSPIGPNCTHDDVACLHAAGVDGNWVLVRPLELRWPMHWVEVGLHVLLAAGALALLFVRLRRPLGR
jgi:hypothetical protein